MKFDSVFIDDIDGPAIKTIDFLPESDKLKIEIKGLSFGIVLYGKFTLNFTEFNLLEAVREVVDIVDYENSRQNKMEILFE